LKTEIDSPETGRWKRMLLVTLAPFERIVLCALIAWLTLYALYCCQTDRAADARTAVLLFGVVFLAFGAVRLWFSRASTWPGWILAWGCFLVIASLIIPWENAKNFLHQLGNLIF
jgi:hypothetical protein